MGRLCVTLRWPAGALWGFLTSSMIRNRRPIAAKLSTGTSEPRASRRLALPNELRCHLLIDTDADELKVLNTSGLIWGSVDPKPACTSADPARFGPRSGFAKRSRQSERPGGLLPKPTTDDAKERSHQAIDPQYGGFAKRTTRQRNWRSRPRLQPAPAAGKVRLSGKAEMTLGS